MQQLTFRDLVELFEELKKQYSIEEILKMPIYIGNDDELNGIHCAWYCQEVNAENEDDEYIIELVNDRAGNNEIKDKAILIS